MSAVSASSSPRRVLVSDFDGTMTRQDFYHLVRERWPVPADDDPWDWYVAGRCTHFEALAAIFARIRTDETTLLKLLDDMELDPALPSAIQRLQAAGWEIVVASAGCEWYLKRLLQSAGVAIEVHANPGEFSPEAGLKLTLPENSRFFDRNTGIDKVGVVRDALGRTPEVAFAGDGRPDLPAALLVPGARRFARGWLAGELTNRGEAFHALTDWNALADTLLQSPSA